MMKRKSKQDNPLLAAAVVGMSGFQVGICIFLGYLVGDYIAERFNMTGWIVGGVLIGLAIGIISSILVVMKVMGGSDG
jgi:ATP synthase protein I